MKELKIVIEVKEADLKYISSQDINFVKKVIKKLIKVKKQKGGKK